MADVGAGTFAMGAGILSERTAIRLGKGRPGAEGPGVDASPAEDPLGPFTSMTASGSRR